MANFDIAEIEKIRHEYANSVLCGYPNYKNFFVKNCRVDMTYLDANFN